jgi:hypothetical protein
MPKPKKISPFWFEVVLEASGASDPYVPMDATFIFIAGVVDIANKHSFAIISANF